MCSLTTRKAQVNTTCVECCLYDCSLRVPCGLYLLRKEAGSGLCNPLGMLTMTLAATEHMFNVRLKASAGVRDKDSHINEMRLSRGRKRGKANGGVFPM